MKKMTNGQFGDSLSMNGTIKNQLTSRYELLIQFDLGRYS